MIGEGFSDTRIQPMAAGGPPVQVMLKYLTVCLTLYLVQGTRDERPGAQPNIVFILADDLGYNDIGYHNPTVRSPNLNALSAAGVRLENYYVQPICTPTRSQLLSGRMQIHTGLQHGVIRVGVPNGLPLDSPTMADKLKEAGYATHAVGKWHLGQFSEQYLPTARGFDTFYGIYGGSLDHFTHRRCRRRGRRRQCGVDLHDDTQERRRPVMNETGIYSTHLYTRKAMDIINSHNGSKPLFLYLSYQAVHGPLQVPDRYLRGYHHIRSRKRRKFLGMVSALDEGVGQVVNALRDSRLLSNTVIIFSTDNGGQPHKGGSNYPLRGSKGSLLEGGIRAVGFVTSPLLSMTGYVNTQLMHITDWFPTLINLANGNLNGTRDIYGYDQWQTISNNRTTDRTYILHNIDPYGVVPRPHIPSGTFDTEITAAYREGDYKVITGPKTRRGSALFNVAQDPMETTDLSSEEPELKRAMLSALVQFQATAVPVNFPRRDGRARLIHGPEGSSWGPWRI